MDLHWLPPGSRHGKSVLLEGDEARHILRSRRKGVGDELVFTEGDGRILTARIDRCDRHTLHAHILTSREDHREARAVSVTLALALLKGDHFELALEKCVELGVRRVIPLLADHSVVQWKPSSAEHKLERWRRIAISAMKQSGRSRLHSILSPCSLEDLAPVLEEGSVWVVADETEQEHSVYGLELSPEVPRVALVGPEGGFSTRERDLLSGRGGIEVSLSSYRLRAETAAVVIVAALAGADSLTTGGSAL